MPPVSLGGVQLDPTRLDKGEDRKRNLANLTSTVNAFADAIFKSVDNMPPCVLGNFSPLFFSVPCLPVTALGPPRGKVLTAVRDERRVAVYDARYAREMARIFSSLRTTVKLRFPNEEIVQYTVVSGFLFLRLFVAATLTPVLFGLWHGMPPQRPARRRLAVDGPRQERSPRRTPRAGRRAASGYRRDSQSTSTSAPRAR